jgi:hypothetical protein
MKTPVLDALTRKDGKFFDLIKLAATPVNNSDDTNSGIPSSNSDEVKTIQLNSELRIHIEKHDTLLDHLMDIIAPHCARRNLLLTRYSKISLDLAGYQANLGVSKEQEDRYLSGEANIIPDQRYPLAQGHVDDIVTSIMQILWPAKQMYGSQQADPSQENVNNAFVTNLNLNSQQYSHYTEYSKMLNNAVAFNDGGLIFDWERTIGYAAHRVNQDGSSGATEILFEGNSVKCTDLFNSIWDYECEPARYSAQAQFYAHVEQVSSFRIKKDALEQRIYGPSNFLKEVREFDFDINSPRLKNSHTPFYNKFTNKFNSYSCYFGTGGFGGLYYHRPEVRNRALLNLKNNNTFDINKYFNTDTRATTDTILPNEYINIYVRIIPKDFGLSDTAEMQIWEFKILNGTWIIYGAQTSLAHGLLPVTRTQPRSDLGRSNSKSIAERLIPFQDQISSTMNLYIREKVKNTNNGMIFYDQKALSLDEMKDPSSGFVPVSRENDDPTAKSAPISNYIHNINSRPEINTSISDINQIVSIMQNVMPTEQTKQLADLNRATVHQSESFTNAASRRIFLLARTISDEAYTPGMYMMTQNTIMNSKPISVLDGNGNKIDIDPKTIKDSGIAIAVSDGLRGIDTVAISQSIRDIIQYTLQSPSANQDLDVVKLIAHLMHIQGASFDIENFRFQNPYDKLTAPEKQQAFQLLQQAAQQAQAQKTGNGG